jgi:hypothetical protein
LSASLPSTDDLGQVATETEDSDALHSDDDEDDDRAFLKKRVALAFQDDEESEDAFEENY